MKNKIFGTVLLVSSVVGCRFNTKNSSDPSANIGVPDSILSKVRANLAAEEMNALIVVSKKLKEANLKEVQVSLSCTDGHDKNATHCHLAYTGPEVEVVLKEGFYNLGRGSVVVGAGKKGMNLWFRTYDEVVKDQKLRVLEYCKIDGVKAIAGLTYGKGTWKMGLNVDGIKLVLRETGKDGEGQANYVTEEGILDVGIFGSYPSENCRT